MIGKANPHMCAFAFAAIVIGVASMGLNISTAQAAGAAQIEVDVVGANGEQGAIGCQLFASEAGFPRDLSASVAKTLQPIRGAGAQCVFRGLEAGSYAVAVMHDENGNRTLDFEFRRCSDRRLRRLEQSRARLVGADMGGVAFHTDGGREKAPDGQAALLTQSRDPTMRYRTVALRSLPGVIEI